MPDLGLIGTLLPGTNKGVASVVTPPQGNLTVRGMGYTGYTAGAMNYRRNTWAANEHINTQGWSLGLTKVQGVVTENAVPVARSLIIIREDTQEILWRGNSDGSGNFTAYLMGYSGEVTVLAYDAAAAPDFNAAVYAKVTPVAM